MPPHELNALPPRPAAWLSLKPLPAYIIPGMDKNNATEAFIQRWQGVTASELSTAQSFVMDFCDLLGVEKPHPTSSWEQQTFATALR